MKRRTTQNRIINTTAAIALLAGSTCVLAGPQSKSDSKQSTASRTDAAWNDRESRLNDRSLSFAYASDLIGASLLNPSEEEIGSIKDLIVDRGTGAVEYAVVESGGLMGFGGRTIAMDFNDLSYLRESTAFASGLTQKQIERRSEFLPERWSGLEDRGWLSMFDDREEHADRWDDPELMAVVKDGVRTAYKGTVKDITRYDRFGTDEIHLSVLKSDGDHETIVLGPSWHVMGSANAPRKGDSIEVEAVEFRGQMIAVNAEIEGEMLKILDDKDSTTWNSDRVTISRYMLLSDLLGKTVELDGSTVGDIQDLVVETNSGTLSLVAFDPNENFLGLGDELSAIPWMAFRPVSDDKFTLDMPERKLDTAPSVPDDLKDLSVRSYLRRYFSAFEQDMPSFRVSDKDRNRIRTGNAWAEDSVIVTTFRDGDDVEVAGVFDRFDTVRLIEGVPEARVLILKDQGKVKRFIVGPVWFADRQDLDLEEGDRITIIGRNGEVDGVTRTLIWSVSREGSAWDFWTGEAPNWTD